MNNSIRQRGFSVLEFLLLLIAGGSLVCLAIEFVFWQIKKQEVLRLNKDLALIVVERCMYRSSNRSLPTYRDKGSLEHCLTDSTLHQLFRKRIIETESKLDDTTLPVGTNIDGTVRIGLVDELLDYTSPFNSNTLASSTYSSKIDYELQNSGSALYGKFLPVINEHKVLPVVEVLLGYEPRTPIGIFYSLIDTNRKIFVYSASAI